MKRTLALLLCVAPLAVTSVSAWCSAFSSATISNVRVALVDLDATNGVLPSIVFDPYGTSTSQANVFASLPSAINLHRSAGGDSPFAPTAASVHDGNAFGTASIVGDAFGTGAAVSVSARTSAMRGFSISEGTVGFANQLQMNRFTLSADTELVISGDATFAASAAHNQSSEQANSSLLLFFGDTDGNWGSIGSWVVSGVYADQSSGGPQTRSTSFSIVYDNASSSEIDASVGGYLDAYAASSGPVRVSPVPEPATTALLLLGLGACVRRCGARLRTHHAAAPCC